MSSVNRIEAPLSQHRLKTLVFHSFKYAQGDRDFGLHKAIFEYLQILHPTWKFTDSLSLQTLASLLEPTRLYIKGTPNQNYHPAMANEKILKNLVEELAKMKAVFAGIPKTREETLPTIVEGTLARDYRFITRGGRRRTNPQPNQQLQDSYFSYFRDHIVMQSPTHIAEYDFMFSDAHAYWQRFKGSERWHIPNPAPDPADVDDLLLPGERLAIVAKIWEQEHPEQRFFN